MIELEGGLGFLRIHDNGLVEIKNATTKGRFYLDDVIALKYTNPSSKANGSLEFKLNNKQAYTISFYEEYTDDYIFLKDWLIEKFGYREYYGRTNTNAQIIHNSHKRTKKHSNSLKTILIVIGVIGIVAIVVLRKKLNEVENIYKPVNQSNEVEKTIDKNNENLKNDIVYHGLSKKTLANKFKEAGYEEFADGDVYKLTWGPNNEYSLRFDLVNKFVDFNISGELTSAYFWSDNTGAINTCKYDYTNMTSYNDTLCTDSEIKELLDLKKNLEKTLNKIELKIDDLNK